jgi:SAM-dependent methyltransferase
MAMEVPGPIGRLVAGSGRGAAGRCGCAPYRRAVTWRSGANGGPFLTSSHTINAVAAGTRVPLPPFHLANRVLALEGYHDVFEAYERLGAETRTTLLDLLPDDWSFEDRRVLDFGCGAGRTLRHFLNEANRAEVWGADIDAASIRWLEQSLSPPLHVRRSPVLPPLGLEYGSLDLAWAISVFTHLTDSSTAWLLELHRLLKPGGLLIATYMGRWNSEVFTGEAWDEDRVGRNVLRHNQNWDSGGPMVLMSDWWVRAHWGRAFEILDVVSQVHGQTWVLMQKREGEMTPEELERPADDPREFTALRHNLRQVQRELELAEASVRREYEESTSWLVTRPLREGARLARTLRLWARR